jgi:hypothetical protein
VYISVLNHRRRIIKNHFTLLLLATDLIFACTIAHARETDVIAAEEEVDGGHLNLVPIDASARIVNRSAQ